MLPDFPRLGVRVPVVSDVDSTTAEAENGVARGSRNRQRQRLIDACISALHIHGPSRTTVEKVVALANLSPGIVRFYFRSKAAMLVASLQYLATEFDEKVLVPVSEMRDTPVEAMRRLVELYLDPELASPRKISVWYAFWGEATARQEYYEICGQKDDSFVALVRELMRRLVVRSGDAHLDVEALSLGFIGLLEVLWQGFAFQSEQDIDRTAARERCLAYLRSIFPRQFAGGDGTGTEPPLSAPAASGSPRGADVAIRSAAQIIGHESEFVAPGDYRAADLAGLPFIVLRDADNALHAFVNRCPHSPHELVHAGTGRDLRGLACHAHGLAWTLAGEPTESADGPRLTVLPIRRAAGFVVALPREDGSHPLIDLLAMQPELSVRGRPREWMVDADWTVIVEHWLDVWFAAGPVPRLGLVPGPVRVDVDRHSARVDWQVNIAGATSPWSLARLAGLAQGRGATQWTRHFVAPNTLLEHHAGGLGVVTVMPLAPGRSWIARAAYVSRQSDRAGLAMSDLAARAANRSLREDRTIAESLQRAARWQPSATGGSTSSAVAAFRDYLCAAVSRAGPG